MITGLVPTGRPEGLGQRTGKGGLRDQAQEYAGPEHHRNEAGGRQAGQATARTPGARDTAQQHSVGLASARV